MINELPDKGGGADENTRSGKLVLREAAKGKSAPHKGATEGNF